MTRIGQGNISLRTQSLDALLKISDYPLMDYALQIDRVMDDTGTDDQRHLINKMTLVQDLIYKHKIDESKYDQTKLAKFGIKYLDHDNAEVRANGFITMLRQYEQMGNGLTPHLSSMRAIHKDVFDKATDIFD